MSAGPMDDLARFDRFEDLSALLDGELDPARAAEVEGWIATDPEARAEYESLAAVRAMVRGLPPVEPPAGTFDRLEDLEHPEHLESSEDDGVVVPLRRRRVRYLVGAAVVAVAASFVVLAGLLPLADGVAPPLSAYAARHEAMLAAQPMPTDDGFAPVDMHDPVAMQGMTVPEAVGPMPAQSAYASGDAVHATYAVDGLGLSLFEQPGTVDWSALPADGQMMDLDGDKAWLGTMDGMEVVVLERGGTVFTAIFQGHHDEMMAAIAEL